MIALIKFLWTGLWPCRHKWETTTKANLEDDMGRTGLRYILTCVKCGEVKKVDLI